MASQTFGIQLVKADLLPLESLKQSCNVVIEESGESETERRGALAVRRSSRLAGMS